MARSAPGSRRRTSIVLSRARRGAGIPAKTVVWTVVLCLGIAISPVPAGTHGRGAEEEDASSAGEAAAAGTVTGTASAEFVIGKEDVLKITVFGEDALNVERVPVRPDGQISLPLLGDVRAEGETPEQLSAKLTGLYTEHVLAPVVAVIMVEINSFKVYVLGKVTSNGEYKLGRETTLLQVLALAGGFTEFANTKRILVIREDENGRAQRIQVNYEHIVSGQNMAMNLNLKPGDTIVVP